MRRFANFLLVGVILFLYASTLYAPWVKGYYRKNGTYVQGYWRNPPNKYKYDNKNFDKWDSPYLTDWYNKSWFSSKSTYETQKRIDDYSRQSEPVKVRGYYRNDGTYVRPHTRSRPPKQYNWWDTPYYLDPSPSLDYGDNDYGLDTYDYDYDAYDSYDSDDYDSYDSDE